MIDFDIELPQELCEPEAAYSVNTELNLAWEIIEETGANLFLTGRAGTGKTTFLKKLREDSEKNMIVLAPTGVAAINAGGSTIHSFFQLPFSAFIPGQGFLSPEKRYLNISREKRRLISTLSLIVIDEISMVRPDMLDAIDYVLRHLRNSRLPFGGLQILMIGDLRQLPPVIKDEEWELLKDYYPTPYFFESLALKNAGYLTVELSVVYRQTDHKFLDILNSIRSGKVDSNLLNQLNQRYIPHFNPDDSEGYIRLTTHNYRAAAINNERLASLPSEEVIFKADISGSFPESAFPAEQELHLKERAQVMFVKNDSGTERRFYNGMLGIIESISEDKIRVRPLGSEVVLDVVKTEWENLQYQTDEETGKVSQSAVGTFLQFPLQLAWAITIHKSQGLTFNKAIIDTARSFAPGQTYVALSRCRTLEGVVLDSPIPPQAIITDENVNEFVKRHEADIPDNENLRSLKNRYLLTLLSELFDYSPLRICMAEFGRYMNEYVIPLYPEKEDELKKISKTLSDNIVSVGDKFIRQCHEKNLETELEHSESPLSVRIKKGCNYFLHELEQLEKELKTLPIHVANKKYANRLFEVNNKLQDIISLKMLICSFLSSTDFSIKAYLNAKARAYLKQESEKSQYKQKNKKKNGEKKTKGYSTFETLKLFKERKSIPQIAEARNLTENTVASHLSQLIRLKRIELTDVVDLESCKLGNLLFENNSEIEFNDFYNSFRRIKGRNNVPKYIIKICFDNLRNKA